MIKLYYSYAKSKCPLAFVQIPDLHDVPVIKGEESWCFEASNSNDFFDTWEKISRCPEIHFKIEENGEITYFTGQPRRTVRRIGNKILFYICPEDFYGGNEK